MKTSSASQKENTNDNKPEERLEEATSPYPHETNMADGGEFLDDGIRSKDQPYGAANAGEHDGPSIGD